MRAWLQLIRWKNLLIISLTQLLVWWCIVLPGNPEILRPLNFFLLTCSTVLIAAAGYIINDYFDVKIDQINHPEKVVLGKVIPRKTAIIAHTVTNLVALALAGYVAGSAHHLEWLLLQIGCAGLLWFYSTTYKRQYMTGNITVAILSALTIMVLYVYEPTMWQAITLPFGRHGQPSSLRVWILAVYTYFAFMLTWVREIVKDMEDLKGDDADGCVTMPIVRGLAYAARFASALALLAIIPLVMSSIVLYLYGYFVLALYALLLLAAPLVVWVWYLWHGVANPMHYHKCSRYIKIIMVLGICSLLVYKLQ